MTIQLNNTYTNEEIEKIINETVAELHTAYKTADNGKERLDQAKQTIARVNTSLHNVLESYGLNRDAKTSKEYLDNKDYAAFKEDWCTAMSAKRKEPVKTSKTGQSIFSDAVKKQWSRITTAYRENNADGTQSEADKRAKELKAAQAAKDKTSAKLLGGVADAYEVLVESEDTYVGIKDQFGIDSLEAAQAMANVEEVNSKLRALLDRAVQHTADA